MAMRSKSEEEIAAFRERVCAAALRLFAAKGPDNVSMRQIAAEIGVSTMLTYRYFRDRDDVLAAVRTNGFDRLAEQLENAMQAPEDARARAAAVSSAYVDFAESNMPAYHLMFEASQSKVDYPELQRATKRARETMFAYVRGLIAEGLIAGDPTVIGNMFWAAMHGIIVLDAAGNLGSDVDAASLRKATFATLYTGLSKTAPQIPSAPGPQRRRQREAQPQ